MSVRAVVAASAALLAAILFGLAPDVQADRLAHTFSIVARDPTTGDMGVADAAGSMRIPARLKRMQALAPAGRKK